MREQSRCTPGKALSGDLSVVTSRLPRAFTLIELLVVVAIIALLLAILLPSLGAARARSRMVVCASNLHQLGLGIAAYSSAARRIPHGPDVQPMLPYLEGNDGRLSTSQVWTGPQEPMKHTMGLGLLLGQRAVFPTMLYCPGDDSNDPQEELAKITRRQMAPGYSSYLYRQLDQTSGPGGLESLGHNELGRRAVALALDMNSLITVDPSFRRTNHQAKQVNILFIDGSARLADNARHPYAIADEHLADTAARRATILQTADARY